MSARLAAQNAGLADVARLSQIEIQAQKSNLVPAVLTDRNQDALKEKNLKNDQADLRFESFSDAILSPVVFVS